MYDGIHNACLIHQHDYRLGKSHRECRGKYPDRAFTEELARLAGPEPENDRQQDSHDYIDRRDLGEGPSQSDAAVSLGNNNSQKDKESQYFSRRHFFRVRHLILRLHIQIFILHQAQFRIFLDFPAVRVKSRQSDHIEYRQTRGPESDSRKQGQPHDLLGHSGGKCIHQA